MDGEMRSCRAGTCVACQSPGGGCQSPGGVQAITVLHLVAVNVPLNDGQHSHACPMCLSWVCEPVLLRS